MYRVMHQKKGRSSSIALFAEMISAIADGIYPSGGRSSGRRRYDCCLSSLGNEMDSTFFRAIRDQIHFSRQRYQFGSWEILSFLFVCCEMEFPKLAFGKAAQW